MLEYNSMCQECQDVGFLDPATKVHLCHPGGNPGANFESIFYRCYLREVASEWVMTKETIYLPLGFLPSGFASVRFPDYY